MVVFRRNTLIHFWHAPTGTFSSSFQTEKTSLITAISWLEQNDDWFSASIITDFKSLLQALYNLNITDPSLTFLNTSIVAFYLTKSIRLIRVPGNELADEQDKLGLYPPPTYRPTGSTNPVCHYSQKLQTSSIYSPPPHFYHRFPSQPERRVSNVKERPCRSHPIPVRSPSRPPKMATSDG